MINKPKIKSKSQQ